MGGSGSVLLSQRLITLGYSRQINRKTKKDSRHPDRDGQFQPCRTIRFGFLSPFRWGGMARSIAILIIHESGRGGGDRIGRGAKKSAVGRIVVGPDLL